jgi:hypothetical protein
MQVENRRTIGHPLMFDDPSIDNLCSNIEEIKENLRTHGVVCIKKAFLREDDLIRLGEALGNELVILPPELSFNNKDPKYPAIARVGNVLMDGTIKDSKKEATIWH